MNAGVRRIGAYLCLAATLCGQAAQARTYDIMVVVPNGIQQNVAYCNQQAQAAAMRTATAVFRILDIANANYSTIQESKCRVEWIRTGLFGRGAVTSGIAESVDSARCVIVMPFIGVAAANFGLKLDSLTRSARGGPLVPMLGIFDNSGTGIASANADYGQHSFFDDAAVAAQACSVGVVGSDIAQILPGSSALWPYMKSDPTLRWRFFSYQSPAVRNPSHHRSLSPAARFGSTLHNLCSQTMRR